MVTCSGRDQRALSPLSTAKPASHSPGRPLLSAVTRGLARRAALLRGWGCVRLITSSQSHLSRVLCCVFSRNPGVRILPLSTG